MSVDGGSVDAPLPEGYGPVELRTLVDDADAPSELTVYPAGADAEELMTNWITVDVDHAVSLSDAR